jgi:hypothetical protein
VLIELWGNIAIYHFFEHQKDLVETTPNCKISTVESDKQTKKEATEMNVQVFVTQIQL